MGDIFGKYQLVDKIAEGGMAEVFLARQEGEIGGFSKDVAIKRMFPHLAEEQEIIDMFLDEGRIAASLTHPNIVQVYDLGVVGEHMYIAMEFVEGKDLRSVLEQGFEVDNSLPLELAASIVSQVAAGLHYAHTRTDDDGNPMNIIHRDISPQNVLLSMDGAVKICDFGIAKAEHRIGHTKVGQVKGKWSYMAPEQIEAGEVSPQSDIFALGIMLYETTTMTRLFQADNQYEALEKILYAQFDPPSQIRAGYPNELEKIVMKALSRDPDNRFQNAEEMQLEIENFLVQNQASTSPVHIARYMRNLFGDPFKARRAELTKTAEIEVDDEEIRAEDAKAAAKEGDVDPSEAAAAQEEARQRALKKKDVTEMDEMDLDFALDNALGAPGEGSADPFALQKPSEASEATADDEAEPPAAVGAPADVAETLVDREKPSFDDKTIITQPDVEQDRRNEPKKPAAELPTIEDEDEGDATTITAQKEMPTPAAPAPVAPEPEPVVSEPEPEPEPVAAAPASTPAATPAAVAPPPAARSGSVPTAPPPAASGPPPSSTHSQEARARAAMEPERPSPADLSADFGDAVDFKTGNKKGIIAFAGLILALAVIGAIVVASYDTSDSTLEKEAEKTQIDPALLETKIPDPLERVSVPYEVTPAEASVVVNGLMVDGKGTLPLVKGERNEVRFYADGHAPAVQYVDGESSGSPITVALAPIEAPDAEAVADLEIVTEPRDALVYVDGKQIGTSPTTVQGLSTQFDHHVEIKKDGKYSYAGLIGLVPKSANLIETTLHDEGSARKNYVEVVFSALPRGTIVAVDGEKTGATKSFKNYDRNKHLSVEFSEPDSRPSRHYVVLEGVGTVELRPFLQKMSREKGTISVYVEPDGPDLYIGANSYGEGPAQNLSFPEGPVKVVLDSAAGRGEVHLEVLPNAHTDYVVIQDADGKVTSKKK